MLIGLAGVTSTGKTTLAGAIKDEFGDSVSILNKISRQEIYEYIGHPEFNPNLAECSNKERIMFDTGRCLLQMKKEIEVKAKMKREDRVKRGYDVLVWLKNH